MNLPSHWGWLQHLRTRRRLPRLTGEDQRAHLVRAAERFTEHLRDRAQRQQPLIGRGYAEGWLFQWGLTYQHAHELITAYDGYYWQLSKRAKGRGNGRGTLMAVLPVSVPTRH